MKKLFVLAVAIVIVIAMVSSAMAFFKPVTFTPKGADKVVWDNKVHMSKGLKCADCHDGIFKKKIGGNPMTMKDMEAGKGCGACHNGTKSFDVKDKAACGKCHKK